MANNKNNNAATTSTTTTSTQGGRRNFSTSSLIAAAAALVPVSSTHHPHDFRRYECYSSSWRRRRMPTKLAPLHPSSFEATEKSLLCARSTTDATTTESIPPVIDQSSVVVSCLRGGAASGDDPEHSDDSSSSGKHWKSWKHGRTRRDNDDDTASEESDHASSESASSSSKRRRNRSKSKKTEDSDKKKKNHPSSSSSSSSSATPPIVEEILKQDDYYRVLGLYKNDIMSQSTTEANDKIKKAYRRRALQTHPDKTDGDRRAFDKVAEAYDVLSDDKKRRIYDRFGKKGVQNNSNHGSGFASSGAGFASPEDVFRSFFGGGGGNGMESPFSRASHSFMRRNRTLRYQLEVTLEDLYRGAQRDILVAPPGGGSRGDASSSTKKVAVQIRRGALSGERIVLSGEMDFDSNDIPGDLVFELRQRKHAVFTRKNHDLAISLEIRLQDALTGVRQKIRFLDGKDIILESARREVGKDGTTEPIMIRDGDVHVMKGYGMPKNMQGHEFGDLYVQYHVGTPKPKANSGLTMEEREQLGMLLDKLEGHKRSAAVLEKPSSSSSSDHSKSLETLQLKKGNVFDFGRASGIPERRSDPHTAGMDDDEDASPFSSGARSQFFFSSSSSDGGAANPFFGMRQEFGDDMEGDMQCQQM